MKSKIKSVFIFIIKVIYMNTHKIDVSITLIATVVLNEFLVERRYDEFISVIIS